MRLTIAFDDVSLPLPPMERPDNRQLVIEEVLDLAAAAGVDDVALIVALALHRRMTEAELRHALGDRIYDAFAPNGLLTQHDAEDPDALVHLGLTDQGEDVEINRRAAESDLLVYVNINLVAMDGGHKSVATGLASYRSLRHHHNPLTMQKSRSFMDQHHSELHTSNWRMGRLIAASGVKVFQIETTLNNDTFPPPSASSRSASGSGAYETGPSSWPRRPPSTARRRAMARSILHSVRAPHRMTSVQAGEVEAVHAVTTDTVWRQQGVAVEGQTDVLTMGLPYICPYNVNSIMNPILVACLGLGYFFNLYRGRAARPRGRRRDHVPPDTLGVQPVHHPELHRLLRAGAEPDHRPGRDRRPVRGVVRHRSLVHPPLPHRPRLPRRPSLLHVVLVRPRPPAPRRGDRGGRRPEGRPPARLPGRPRPWPTPSRWPPTWSGPVPTLTHLHNPPILMADVQ